MSSFRRTLVFAWGFLFLVVSVSTGQQSRELRRQALESAAPKGSLPVPSGTAIHANDSKVTIFVGPQTREGFVDLDSGVLDSIRDIKNELNDKKGLQVVVGKERAQVVLDVLSRGATSNQGGGAVAMPIGTSTFLIPIGTIGIATVLRVGTYEKQIVFQNCESWRNCARLVAKDLETWIEGNRSAFNQK